MKLVIKPEIVNGVQASSVYKVYKEKRELKVEWLACFKSALDALDYTEKVK